MEISSEQSRSGSNRVLRSPHCTSTMDSDYDEIESDGDFRLDVEESDIELVLDELESEEELVLNDTQDSLDMFSPIATRAGRKTKAGTFLKTPTMR